MEPQPPEPAAQREAPAIIPRQRPIVSVTELVLQLVIVTAGVLIALFIESLVEWNHYRALVREARANIALEIADNKKEVESVIATAEERGQHLENALRFANDLLSTKTTTIDTLNLGFNLAELSSASWQSAGSTGALAHMAYAEVQEYSRLYGFQDFFAEQQRRAMDRLAAAMSILAVGVGDPTQAAAQDLESFRQHVLALRAELGIEAQLAARLVKNYQKALQAHDGR